MVDQNPEAAPAPPAAPDPVLASRAESLAARLESIAEALEQTGP